jgi:hypothetical protein
MRFLIRSRKLWYFPLMYCSCNPTVTSILTPQSAFFSTHLFRRANRGLFLLLAPLINMQPYLTSHYVSAPDLSSRLHSHSRELYDSPPKPECHYTPQQPIKHPRKLDCQHTYIHTCMCICIRLCAGSIYVCMIYLFIRF